MGNKRANTDQIGISTKFGRSIAAETDSLTIRLR
jgi:hypothetical protein